MSPAPWRRGVTVSLTAKDLPALLLNGLARTSGVAAFPIRLSPSGVRE